jgi:transposase
MGLQTHLKCRSNQPAILTGPFAYSPVLHHLLISAKATKLWNHEPYGKDTIKPESNRLARRPTPTCMGAQTGRLEAARHRPCIRREQGCSEPVDEAGRAGGRGGLETPTPSGCARSRLSEEQRAELPELLKRGAPAYGFRGEVWTCARVAQVIRREFGVSYHPAHVSRLLKALRLSLQKPERQANQRDEEVIRSWKEERWPSLKKGH